MFATRLRRRMGRVGEAIVLVSSLSALMCIAYTLGELERRRGNRG